jgi:hypothetical protein
MALPVGGKGLLRLTERGKKISFLTLAMRDDSRKALFLAGNFDDYNGKASKIADKIYLQVRTPLMDYLNGGNFKDIDKVVENIRDYKTIFWFPNVDNSKPKLVEDIKKMNENSLLITSKRNVEKAYDFQGVLQHALRIKSNLMLEFVSREGIYHGRVLDPLGNAFLDYNDDFELVGKVLDKRVKELDSYTRVRSESIQENVQTPDNDEFFGIVREYANVFHDLIHPSKEAADRFLGNASFRCENGFPSFRGGDNIFVSQRNVDKRLIGRDSFVAVKAELPIRYIGSKKPSVDTPIQLKLYEFYPNVNFMIHSHTYVKNAPFTSKIIPCGALEEAEEIECLVPDKTSTDFSVNLKGHGSIALASSPEFLKKIGYFSRDMPEVHPDYSKEFL